jgi:rare lipoprotein A
MLRGSFKWAGLTASGLLLAACGSHPPAPSAYSPATPAVAHSQGNYKIGRPYQIDGVWYSPREDWSYDETGIASWYGEQFHGRNTADGEIFDLNSLTAAHRTLPMPVVVRVTNLDNGRSIKLRVNDRGPYARGRIIDVSRRAAQLLGFEGQGTAKVRVQIDVPDSMVVAAAAGRSGSQPPPTVGMAVAEIVSAPLTLPVSALEAMRGQSEPPPQEKPADIKIAESKPVERAPPPAPALVKVADNRPVALSPPRHAEAANDRPYFTDDLPGEDAAPPQQVAAAAPLPAKVEIAPVKQTQIYIQAGAFADQSNAARLQDRLRALGSPVSVTAGVTSGGASVYRVRIGPVASVDAADDLLNRIMSNGVTQARIVVD